MFKKLFLILLLVASFSCEKDFSELINQDSEIISELHGDLKEPVLEELGDVNILSGITYGGLSVNLNYSSYLGNNLLTNRLGKNEYDLNLHVAKNGVWEKMSTMFTYDNYFFIKKAKSSDTFITFDPNTTSHSIDIFEPTSSQIRTIETGTMSTNKIEISNDGKRVFYVSSDQKKMFIIQKISYNNWSNIEIINNLEIHTILNTKFSGNKLMLRYMNPSFTKFVKIFRITEDHKLIEELDITDEINISNFSYNNFLTLSKTQLAFVKEISSDSVTISSYSYEDKQWVAKQDLTITTSSVDTVSYIYLDSLNDYIVFNYSLVSDNNDLLVSSNIYEKNDSTNNWDIKVQNNIEGLSLIGQLYLGRITYHLSSNALDVCTILEFLDKGYVDMKCYTFYNLLD